MFKKPAALFSHRQFVLQLWEERCNIRMHNTIARLCSVRVSKNWTNGQQSNRARPKTARKSESVLELGIRPVSFVMSVSHRDNHFQKFWITEAKVITMICYLTLFGRVLSKKWALMCFRKCTKNFNPDQKKTKSAKKIWINRTQNREKIWVKSKDGSGTVRWSESVIWSIATGVDTCALVISLRQWLLVHLYSVSITRFFYVSNIHYFVNLTFFHSFLPF